MKMHMIRMFFVGGLKKLGFDPAQINLYVVAGALLAYVWDAIPGACDERRHHR